MLLLWEDVDWKTSVGTVEGYVDVLKLYKDFVELLKPKEGSEEKLNYGDGCRKTFGFGILTNLPVLISLPIYVLLIYSILTLLFWIGVIGLGS